MCVCSPWVRCAARFTTSANALYWGPTADALRGLSPPGAPAWLSRLPDHFSHPRFHALDAHGMASPGRLLPAEGGGWVPGGAAAPPPGAPLGAAPAAGMVPAARARLPAMPDGLMDVVCACPTISVRHCTKP